MVSSEPCVGGYVGYMSGGKGERGGSVREGSKTKRSKESKNYKMKMKIKHLQIQKQKNLKEPVQLVR